MKEYLRKIIAKNCDVRGRTFGDDEVKMKCDACGKHFLVSVSTATRDLDKFGGSKCVCGGHTLFPVLSEKMKPLGREWLQDLVAIAKVK